MSYTDDVQPNVDLIWTSAHHHSALLLSPAHCCLASMLPFITRMSMLDVQFVARICAAIIASLHLDMGISHAVLVSTGIVMPVWLHHI